MCDLIDLNSPDVKKLLDPTKLASPLIPTPKNEESNNETNSSVAKKRENEDNNPFDQVLHETAEYISKKGDPFEMMLQRALKSKGRRGTDLKARSVDFTDDFTPRRRQRYLKMMNKTLDSSLLEDKLFNGDRKIKIKKEIHVNLDVKNADVCDNATENASVFKQNCKISITGPELFESSILNHSAMNDTLLEGVPKSIENGVISPLLEKPVFKTFILPSNINLKPLDYQRSLSQGTEKSPLRLSCLSKRSQSLTDGQKSLQNNDNMVSFLDRGFLEKRQSEQSVFSTLSNVSSITKFTSVSMSSVLSNDTINHAFLDDGSLAVSHEKINTPENSLEIKPRLYDLSDLAEKLKRLKCTMNRTTSISGITEDEPNSTKENNEQVANDKLIDIDVFMPEQNLNKEFNKSSTSTSSSDSVFNGTDKINKSILKEAKVLAKTFEELALKTDSGSSMDDDLISNNTLWMSELLPAFEDEPVIDNLIELPFSSEENSEDTRNTDKKQSPTSIDNTEEISLKEVDSQFTDCLPAVKQTVLTSLLSDLRKLVNVENNLEANKLLDNLENALNFNHKNNAELLEMCLNMSNELQKPQKVLSDIVENFEITNRDRNEEENGIVSSKENICDSEKSIDTNHKLENTSQATTVSSDNSSIKLYESNNENDLNTINSLNRAVDITHIKEEDNQPDEKLAIELLVNLGKLLSGQTEDGMTKQLLKNIGKALSVASCNLKIENEVQSDCNMMRDIQQITPVKQTESNRNAYSSALSMKTAHRRNFEPKSKPFEKTARRSISVIDSSPKSTSSTQIREHRDTSKLEDRKKRFSSDPGFISNVGNKKIAIPETSNVRKAGTSKTDTKNENSMSNVKNKLKKRSNVVNKRGPMKAVHPVDNMQKKRVSIGKQTIPPSKITTPPKSDKTTSCNKIVSSTPNSVDNNYVPKKPVKSKPMASSTPDGQNNKPSVHLTSANKKHNLSCDISPVTMYVNMSSSNERKESPKRVSKLPTPKKCTTPKHQQTDSHSIPRYSTPPKHNLSFTNYQQSPQRLNKSLVDYQRFSPVNQKKSTEKIRQSPLKENNRITAKVKPLNLISKIKRHSASDFTEKENNYA